MAEKSSFFNSVSGDRKYSAEDWAAYFASFVSNGVYANPGSGLQVVVASGMSITVKSGSGFINGYFYRNTTDLGKTLSVADGVLNRIDRVVLRWSLLNRTMTVEVLEGTSASSPTATALTRNAETYEIALGDIYIGKGVTSISQSNITDCRYDSSLCGIVTGVIDQFDFTAFCAKFDAFYTEYSDEANALLAELREQISQAASQQLVDKSVTRIKLADDALYSPISDGTTVTIGADNIGETIRFTAGTCTANVAKNSGIPAGAEYAILRTTATSVKIVFGTNIKVGVSGEDDWLTSPTLEISDCFSMTAIKKLTTDSTYDYWLVTGSAEVT